MKPRSDAHALHDLLAELIAPGNIVIHRQWGEILGAEYNTVEYARRYSEVVGLFTNTVAQVASMPARSRERFERYEIAWWRAVIAPEHAWQAQEVPGHALITQEALDQLGSAAEIIEARMDGSLAVPNSDDLEPLQASCEEWIEALDGNDCGLPQTLRMNLLQDLEHIVWLIEHADLFGVARVTAASQAAVGSMALVATRVPPAKRGVWLQRAKKFINALVVLSALLQGIDVGLELGGNAVDFLGELTDGPADATGAVPEPANTD